jgi:hypothetical protein
LVIMLIHFRNFSGTNSSASDNSSLVAAAEMWPIIEASGWLSILLSIFKENVLAPALVHFSMHRGVVNEILPRSAHMLHGWCFAIHQYGRMTSQSLSKGATSKDSAAKCFLCCNIKGTVKNSPAPVTTSLLKLRIWRGVFLLIVGILYLWTKSLSKSAAVDPVSSRTRTVRCLFLDQLRTISIIGLGPW